PLQPILDYRQSKMPLAELLSWSFLWSISFYILMAILAAVSLTFECLSENSQRRISNGTGTSWSNGTASSTTAKTSPSGFVNGMRKRIFTTNDDTTSREPASSTNQSPKRVDYLRWWDYFLSIA